MATDPRIKYDIVANAQGEQDVERLARALEQVDKAIDPVAAQRAQQLAAELRQLGAQSSAINAFVDLKAKVGGARTELEGLQQQAQKLGAELAQIEKPTRAQVGQLEKLRDAVRAGKTELTAQVQALDASRAALTRLGLSSDQVATAQQRVRTQLQESQTAAAQLGARYEQTANAAVAGATKQVAAQREVQQGLNGISEQLGKLQGLVVAAYGGNLVTQAARQVADVADQYNNLAARVKLVTGEGEAFQGAFQGVFDIATRTGSAVETVGTLFTKVAQAGKALNLSQQQSLALTETITQAVALSGETADASDAAIRQLIQGLQSGVLRGEEFNSVMEQSPRLARALADGLGVTTGQLRQLANQGELTSDTVIRALQGQAAAIQQEFASLPPTVGRALQNLSTEWTRYVGETDKATGASATAAKGIGVLAENLSTLVGTVKLAGEAYLAFKALDLAGVLIRQATAAQAATVAAAEEASARTAAARATLAQTEALVANTTAQAANARTAATGAAGLLPTLTQGAATVGLFSRLLGVVGLAGAAVALFGDVFATAFKKAGTWIGEGIAKLQGFKDRSDEVLANQKAMDEAARLAAQQQAALAQQLQISADRALGLSDAARKIVGDFAELEKKGESTATILAKVTKDLDLGNIKGIGDAIAALDALEQKGKLTGQQVREALTAALDGKDLGVFEAQARAAFDGSAQGARRLGAALDAIAAESLKRVGSSVEELATGFNKASASAINDVDALATSLKQVGASAEDTARLLGSSLDKALSVANTERAVNAVIDRLKALGKQGLITGDQLAEGLDKAKRKIDELKPGISSLDEALRTFGLQTRAELQDTADKLGRAYRLIANDITVSLQEKATAFSKYSEAAIAANKGVETGEVRLQRVMLENQLAAAGLGNTIKEAMDKAKKATDDAAAAQAKLGALMAGDPTRLVGGSGLGGINDLADRADSPRLNGQRNTTPSLGDNIRNTKSGDITRTLGFQLTPPDNTPGWEFDVAAWQAAGSPVFADDRQDDRFWKHKAGTGPKSGDNAFGGKAGTYPAPAPAPTPAPSPSQPTATPTQVVRIEIGGQGFNVDTSQAGAQQLLDALAQMKRLSGY